MTVPIAGRGVIMSENIITPSILNFSQGCSDNSVAISGFSDRALKLILSEYFRKLAMYLPAFLFKSMKLRRTNRQIRRASWLVM